MYVFLSQKKQETLFLIEYQMTFIMSVIIKLINTVKFSYWPMTLFEFFGIILINLHQKCMRPYT